MIKEINCLQCSKPFPSTEWRGVCSSCQKKIDYYNECITTRKNYPSPRKRDLSRIFFINDVIIKKDVDNPNIYTILLSEAGWEKLKDIINSFLKDNKIDPSKLEFINFQDCIKYDYLTAKAIKSRNIIFIKKDYFCFVGDENKILEESVDIGGTIFIDNKIYKKKYNLHLMITVIKEA